MFERGFLCNKKSPKLKGEKKANAKGGKKIEWKKNHF